MLLCIFVSEVQKHNHMKEGINYLLFVPSHREVNYIIHP